MKKIILLALLLSSQYAFACKCTFYENIEEVYKEADFIVLAKVTKTKQDYNNLQVIENFKGKYKTSEFSKEFVDTETSCRVAKMSEIYVFGYYDMHISSCGVIARKRKDSFLVSGLVEDTNFETLENLSVEWHKTQIENNLAQEKNTTLVSLLTGILFILITGLTFVLLYYSKNHKTD